MRGAEVGARVAILITVATSPAWRWACSLVHSRANLRQSDIAVYAFGVQRGGWREAIAVGAPLFMLQQALEFAILRLLDAPRTAMCGWDCVWYAGLAANGYDAEPMRPDLPGQANWAFFPLFPLLARALHAGLGWDVEYATLLTGKLLFLAAIVATILFVQHVAPQVAALTTGAVVALNPFALYGNTGYTEPLFLLLTSMLFLGMAARAWPAVALIGTALTATRFVGLAAVAAYALDWLRAQVRRSAMPWWPIVVMPLGLIGFAAHLWQRTGDALAFLHVQSAWGRTLQNPVTLLWFGLTSHPVRAYWAIAAILGVLVGLAFLRRRETAFGVFTLAATLAPLMTGLWAMPRFVAWQAPVLLFVARGLRTRLAVGLFVALGVCGQFVMYWLWLREASAAI